MIYFVSKLFKLLFLPPGLFIWLFAFLAYRYKSRLALFGAITLFALSSALSNALLAPLEEWHFAPSPHPPQAVVVLGGGSADSDPFLPLAPHASKRLVTALMIAVQNNLPLVYSGCEGRYARKMLHNLIDSFHLPLKECEKPVRGCFVIEGESRDTYQNAHFTRTLFGQTPSIILVTSAYHMPRSYALFRNVGFFVTPFKSDYLQKNHHYSFWEYLPTMGNLEDSYIALHEYFGLLSLSLRGIL